MAGKTEEINIKVKSDIGQTTKDTKALASEFRIMGVSLNDVKAGFKTVGATAKASFATIKAGIMSTGIGALVLAVGSLITYFTNTKRGADQLARAFNAISTVTSVLIDRISKVGEGLTFVFSGEFRKAGEALKGTFSGITEEITKEVEAMDKLKIRTQELRDTDMEFMVQKAKTRQEIEKARLIAEDETKSAKERLDNLKKALELEAETTEKEIELAKERMQIQKEEMALSENSAEDEQRLAQLQTEIIEKETASVKMRRRVVTEVNALEREIRAEEKARHDEKMAEIDAMTKALVDAEVKRAEGKFERAARFAEIEKENNLLAIEDLFAREQEALRIEREAQTESMGYRAASDEERAILDEQYRLKKEALDKKAASRDLRIAQSVEDGKREMALNGLRIVESIAGEGTALAKAAAAAQITISGIQSVQEAYKSGVANIPMMTATGGSYGYIQAGLAAAFSAIQLQKVMSASTSGAGSVDGGGGAETATPAPQMMSGSFELSGGVAPEAMKAFVVTDEMTNSQNQLANIRRRATI